jgi:medium-chain acyl-[acyl-carrier-protein] hydrolase
MPEALMAQTAPAPDLWPNNPDLSEYDRKKQFHVRMHDLDLNQHVNNTVYVTWAMESLPVSWLCRHTPRTLVVSYLKESFYPDMVIVKTTVSDTAGSLKTCHAIFHQTSGAKLACLTLTWRRISHGPV